MAVPEVRDDWALIRVKACGICGSDLHTARSGAKKWQPFGHEIAGVVARICRHVSTVKEGDQVALARTSSCSHCDLYRNERADLCSKAPNF